MKRVGQFFVVAIFATWFVCYPARLLLQSTFQVNNTVGRAACTTEATVTELQPEIHNTVRFEYEVNGVRYNGSSQGGGSFGPQVGDHVVFHYDPSDPQRGYLGEPPSEYGNFLFLGAILLVMVCGILWKFQEMDARARQ